MKSNVILITWFKTFWNEIRQSEGNLSLTNLTRSNDILVNSARDKKGGKPNTGNVVCDQSSFYCNINVLIYMSAGRA